MPEPVGIGAAAVTIALYLVVLWLPGGLIALAAGVRGWLLAALAPLLSYTVAGLIGPYTSLLGLPFNLLTFVLGTLLLVVVVGGLRLIGVRTAGPLVHERCWPTGAQLAVGACVLVTAVFAAAVVLIGLGSFDSIPQDWDAGFHANGMRYIAETGDGGLYGMSQVNWYLIEPGIFYPNAYHLIGALVYQLSGASIAATLNTATLLTPALFVLSLVALVRAFRGRAALACFTAFVAVAVHAGLYESFARGPLLPYQVGIALTPVLGALALRYLERPDLANGTLFAAGAIGLLAVHSSTLFGAVLILLPMFVQRWVRSARLAGRELLLILVAAVPAMLVTLPHLLGAISIKTNVPTMTWPVDFTPWQAIGRLLTMHNAAASAPLAAAVALWVGLLLFWRLGKLAWLLGSAVLTGAMFVIVASVKQDWVPAFTSPWWNDRWRLITLAVVPLCLLAGHGLAELQRGLTVLVRQFFRPAALPMFTALLVLVVFLPVSKLLYAADNVAIVRLGYSASKQVTPEQMTVSPDEVVAMRKLATLVPPGQRVMNDRMDGSLWMYAVAGVHPVAGHFDRTLRDKRLALLARRFNDYAEDPRVRAVVRQLKISFVMVDTGFVRKNLPFHEPGLRDLADEPYLREVYRNPHAVIYRLVPLPTFGNPFPAQR